MKVNFTLFKTATLIVCCILFSAFGLFAKQVPVQTAQTVAENFFNNGVYSGNNKSVLKHTALNVNGVPLYYVFNFNNGFVIVSAEDAAQPIIGYSTEQVFEIPDSKSPVAFWLSKRQDEIQYLKEQNINATLNIISDWNRLTYSSNFNKVNSSNSATLAPLLSSKWNQSPNYNAMCPGLSVTGCVATTMAQIMRYWQYPAHGTGSSSYMSNYGILSKNYAASIYNWNNMPMVLSGPNADVALINYDCGVSVEMDYSPTGSGAYVINLDNPISAEHSYITYFSYDPSTILGVYRSSYSDPTWISMLKSDLDLSRPVQYAGFGPQGGHTWVCDGYDQNNFFHMNWGWGGSSNGYFNIDVLNPSGGDFSSWQQALFGIIPIATNAIDAGVLSISPTANGCTNNQYAPTIKFRNYGINPLTSCTINYKLDNGATQSVAWTGSLVTGQSDNVTLPNYTLSNAAHSFTCFITNANNGVDANAANDVLVYNFSTFSNDNLPILEGFENASVSSTHWSILPSGGANWSITNQASSGGSKSLMINNLINTPGNTSIIQGLNNYDFSNTIEPYIYFKVAYQQKSTANNDKLSLQISNDCGNTWWSKWSRQGAALASTSVLSNSNFIPTTADFKQCSAYGIFSSNTIFRFVFTADPLNPGNNIYIDDVNIYDTTAVAAVGIKEQKGITTNFQLYPNPTSGEAFVKLYLNTTSSVEIKVTDVCGKEVYSIEKNKFSAGEQVISITNQTNLNKGIYFVTVYLENEKFISKLVIN